MAEIGRWSSLTFLVSSGTVRSFDGLTVEGSVETKDVTNDSIKYVENVARQPTEVSLSVHLDARLGSDVRDLATTLVSYATWGQEDYFYIARKKLVPYRLKLVKATVNKVQLAGDGTWICCDVQMQMKQSGMPDDWTAQPPAAPASGGSSPSVTYPAAPKSQKQTVAPAKSTAAATVASTLSSVVKTGVSKALTAIKKIVTTAKTASKSKIPVTIKAGSGGGGKKYMPLN